MAAEILHFCSAWRVCPALDDICRPRHHMHTTVLATLLPAIQCRRSIAVVAPDYKSLIVALKTLIASNEKNGK